MFEQNEAKSFTCSSCESEFEIVELYSEAKMKFCPYCAEELNSEEDE